MNSSPDSKTPATAEEIAVTLPDGSVRQYRRGVTPREVAASIGRRLARDAVAARLDGDLTDLDRPVEANAAIAIVTADSEDGLYVYRHSSAHLMAQAVKRLFPEARLGIGPPIESGFYYDIEAPRQLTPEDLRAVESEMERAISEDLPIRRFELPRPEALEFVGTRGETYKVRLIEDLPEEERLSFYQQGEFTDLCRGPHLASTGRIRPGTFRLLNVAGAYWRGDERQEMLQRIYATSFRTPDEVEAHLAQLEQARLRDHRRLGKELDLFSIEPEVGGGLVLWHPKGGMIRRRIEEFARQRHEAGGYEFVYSPHLGRSWLWQTSGHLDWYRENMYAPMEMDDGQEYYLKPMNCPFHILIYRSRPRSYRDLPLRYAEWGTVYRYERGGVLHGLMRVRGFTQDDAHLFCRPDQMPEEIDRVLNFCVDLLRAFGFEKFNAYLSTRDPDKAAGTPEEWEAPTEALRAAIERAGLPYEEDAGGATFYGPKIDLKFQDAIGREWQCSTIQFDFVLPERFGLTYVGEDGREHRPYMIHRALLGSMERFFGILIEHYAGAFPLWLAPVQAVVIPVSDDVLEYADTVAERLRGRGARVDVDRRREGVGYKIRDGELQKVPYMLVVGKREREAGTVSVRRRHEGEAGTEDLETFAQRVAREVAEGEAGGGGPLHGAAPAATLAGTIK
ncbi:MAG: threonine--tRNA ligase [Gemmatimonadetes bacterium]|nr:threonine--tRNA ligase [Gemmatimonadota bacterium]